MRPTISPATKTAISDVEEHAVEAGADAAEDHLAEEHVHQRHGAACRGEGVVAAVDRAVRGVGGRGRPERRVGDADRAPPCPACCRRSAVPVRDVHAGVAQHRRAVLLGRVGDADADREHQRTSAATIAHGVPLRASTILPNMNTWPPGSAGSRASRGSSRARSGSRTARTSSSCRSRRRSCRAA